jgi:hypothetical protein
VILASLLSAHTALAALNGSNNAGTLNLPVGQISTPQTAVLIFTTATTPGVPFTINVLTQGTPNLDFNFVSGGTCAVSATYAAGDTCTVLYTFSPRFPGARYGGISLTAGTTPLATTPLIGTGIGPQAAFAPAKQLTLGGNLFFPSQNFAIDGAGNIYTVQNAFSPALVEIPNGCTNASCVIVLTNFADFPGASQNPQAIAIDGSGNFYINGLTPYHAVYELPRGCFSASCAISFGSGISNIPGTVAIDESGKSGATVYTTGSYAGDQSTQTHFYVLEIPDGCMALSCVMPVSQPFINQIDYMRVDAVGNIFFGGTGPASNPSEAGTYEIPAGCKSASCNISFNGVGGGESTSASDSAGNLFVAVFAGYVQYPNTYEFPVGCFDVSCSVIVPQYSYQWYLPRVQMFNGNIYGINDGGYAVTEYDLTDPATVTFAPTLQGQVSPTQTVTLTNEGNFPLAFSVPTNGNNASVSQYFNLDTTSSADCPALTSTSSAPPPLAANASCNYPFTFAPVAPVLGTVNGTAVLTDDNLNVPNASQTIPLVGDSVLPGTTFVSVTSSLNPSFAGQAVSLTANVNSVSGTPTGTVTFTDGATTLGTAPLNTSASASVTATSLPVGTQTITATLTPTGIFLPSSGTLSQAVYPDVAADTLTVTPNPATFGTTVSLSATVVANPPGVAPTGSISFSSNGTVLATVPIINGLATYQTTALPAGSDSIGCHYLGDTNYGPSDCPFVTETISSSAAITALTLTPSANPAGAFAPFSLIAVLSTSGTPVPGIQVTFSVDGSALGTNTTNTQGTIQYNPSGGIQLAPGQHTITAVSAANASYAAANAAFIETVSTIPTTSTLTTSNSSTTFGTSIALSAAIAANLTGVAAAAFAGSGLTPGGTVTFYANGVFLGTAPVNSGAAQLNTTALPSGSDTITCTYSGDANFSPGTCPATGTIITVTNPADFTLSITPASQTVNPGGSATYSVTVTAINGAFTQPVMLSASSLPAGATAAFSQQVLTPGASSATAILTVTTSPYHSLLRQRSRATPVTYVLLLLPLFALRRKSRSRLRQSVAPLIFLAFIGVLSGCGGGLLGSPSQAHTLLLGASSGTVTHSASATLIIR